LKTSNKNGFLFYCIFYQTDAILVSIRDRKNI